MSQTFTQNFGVKVENIDHTISESNLYSLFSEYGGIESVRIPDLSKTWAYVNFGNEEDAIAAVSKMHNRFANGRVLRVTLKPQVDLKKLTDCSYKDACKINNCRYRHIATKDKECKNWRSKKCTKLSCQFSHPSLTSKQEEGSSEKENIEAVSKNPLEIKLEELCQCAICYETMDTPKSLSCKHSFCKECLEKCESSFVSFNSLSQVTIRCPNRCPNENVLQDDQTIGNGLSTELTLKQSLDILESIQHSALNETSKCSNSTCEGPPNTICKSCGFLMCQSCSFDHSNNCQSNRLIPVKYSYKEGSLMAYCVDHDCFCHFCCCNCDAPICMYCKEWSHSRDHSVVSVMEYGKKFEGPLKNCIEDAKKGETFHNNVRRDIDTNSSVNGKSQVLNHLTITKNRVLAKFLYIFDSVEEQIKEEFTGICKDLQNINGKVLQDYESIVKDAESLMISSNIEKIVRTRSLINKLSEIPHVDDSIQSGFRVDINSPLKDDQLDEMLSKVVAESVGMVQIFLKTDDPGYKAITPSVEHILQSSQLKELGDPEKSKEYLNKAGISSTKGETSKKKKGNKKKNKEKKEEGTINPPSFEADASLGRSQSLIDLDSDDNSKEPEKENNKKRRRGKKKEKTVGDYQDNNESNLINFEDNENQKSFNMIDALNSYVADSSSDEDDVGVSISGDSDNSLSTDATGESEASHSATNRTRRWRGRGRGQRGNGNFGDRSNVEGGFYRGHHGRGFRGNLRGGRGDQRGGYRGDQRGSFRGGRGQQRGGRGQERGARGGGGTNYRNLTHAQSVQF